MSNHNSYEPNEAQSRWGRRPLRPSDPDFEDQRIKAKPATKEDQHRSELKAKIRKGFAKRYVMRVVKGP